MNIEDIRPGMRVKLAFARSFEHDQNESCRVFPAGTKAIVAAVVMGAYSKSSTKPWDFVVCTVATGCFREIRDSGEICVLDEWDAICAPEFLEPTDDDSE